MTATIETIHARQVWDSRGRPTIEVEILVEGGSMGRAIAPAGASRGSGEALDLRDGGERLGGHGVGQALAGIAEVIAPALRGMDASHQGAVDRRLIELDGTAQRRRLGANALVATSMAAAQAAARNAGMPLWRHLRGDDATEVTLPLPEIQILGGGAHAGRRLDIQDFMVVCPGASSLAEAFAWTAEIYMAAGRILEEEGRLKGIADEGGFWPDLDGNEQALEIVVRAIERAGRRPGEEVAIALDVAASEFGRGGRYSLARDGSRLDSDGMVELLLGWIARYPIRSVEDPLAEDDAAGFLAFTEAIGCSVQVVGDDFLVTDAGRVRAAAQSGSCNTVLLKPNQRGTLTETLECWRTAERYGMAGIVSARSGETEDVTICHLALGWGASGLKVGSFARGERTAKWNEMLRLEESLGSRARFPGWSALQLCSVSPSAASSNRA